MIDILNRWTRAVVFHSETAQTIAEAVIEARKAGANLSRADLFGANLSRANLSRADLFGANLSRANLSRANLFGANLFGADLFGANLSGANLSGADLSGADLSGADLSGADLSRAMGALPNGVTPLQILGTQHALIVREPGYITIGCEHHPVAWWEEHYRALGRREGYSLDQVNEYRNYIKLAKYWMGKYGCLEPQAEAAAAGKEE
jgi:hypothetical protein